MIGLFLLGLVLPGRTLFGRQMAHGAVVHFRLLLRLRCWGRMAILCLAAEWSRMVMPEAYKSTSNPDLSDLWINFKPAFWIGCLGLLLASLPVYLRRSRSSAPPS